MSELIDIATRHAVHLEQLKAGQKRKIKAFLKEVDKNVRFRLSQDITDFNRSRLESFLKLVESDLEQLSGNYISILETDITELAEYEAAFHAKAMQQVTGVSFALPTNAQLMAAVYENPLSIKVGGSNLLKPFIKGLSPRSAQRISSEIRLGYYQGDSLGKILQRIRGTRAAGYRDGIIARVDFDAETIARTALHHVSEQSRARMYAENDVEEVIWVSTLDSRTSDICRYQDGQIYRESPEREGPRPPLHPRCRSQTVAFTGYQGGTRISRDSSDEKKVKKVAQSKTYYEWLKEQPKKYVEDILGKKRGKLLLDGGMSAERFRELQFDKNFNPRTLEEIKAKEPLAFQRAGI